MPKTLSESYERDGYVVLERVFSEEQVGALKAEAKRVLAEVLQEKRFGANETIGDNDFTKHGVYVGLAARSRLFKEAASNSRLVEALRQIIGDNIMFLSDKAVFKNADTDFGSPWHQDWPYWKGSNKVSVWIALDEAVVGNGCLQVIPGSHLTGAAIHAGEATDGRGFANRVRNEDIDEKLAVSLEAEPGTAIIFHDLLLHASHRNTSGKDRWALISTYKDSKAEDPEYDWAVAAFEVSG